MSSVKAYEKTAEHLEMFGSNRADFRQLSYNDRIELGKRLTIHLTRKNVNGIFDDREQQIFFYVCGKHNISMDEAKIMWRSSTEGDITMDDIIEEYDKCN